MALTIVSSPEDISPVFTNSMPVVVTSTISSQPNFRYIFDVYTQNQPSASISTFKTRVNPFPRPDTTGLYSPHYVLRDNVSYTLQPFITEPTSGSASIVYWKMQLGEEWNPGLTWSDTAYEFAPAGALGLTFATPHGLLVDDIILLNKTDKSLNPQYDGTCSVYAVTNPYHIVTDKMFGYSSVLESGQITDVLRMSASIIKKTGINASRQYDEIELTFSDVYEMEFGMDPVGKFLTRYEGIRYIAYNEWHTLSYLSSRFGTEADTCEFTFYQDGPDMPAFQTVSISLTSSTADTFDRVDIPIGYPNWNGRPDMPVALTGVYNARENGFFTVQLGKTSQIFTYSFSRGYDAGNISEGECQSVSNREYPQIEVAFLNDLGAFEYFTFNLVNKRSIKVNRKKFKKVLAWNYSIGDRGNTIYDADITEEISLTSDWLIDEEALLMAQLIKSPEVYIIQQIATDGSINSNIYPMIVTDDSYEIKNTLNNQLFNFSIKMEFANQIIANI